MATPALFASEFQVNTTTPFNQDTPSVTALANGKFVVVWEDSSQTGGDTSINGVRGQLFNADGSKAGGEFLVNQVTTNSQDDPVVTALTDGRFVVAWQDDSVSPDDPSGPAIRARIFNVDGSPAGNEFLVNTTAGNSQTEPAIAALTGGGFVVTWTHDFSATDQDIRGQAYDPTGAKLGDEFRVDETGATTDEDQSAVIGLDNGNYAVVWRDEGGGGESDGSGSHIRAKIMSGAGTVVVDEFIVNSTAANNQSEPSIALLSNGNFVVTWTSGPGDAHDIVGRIFSPAGAPLGADFIVEADVEEEFESSVTALADGAFMVTWHNASGGESDGSFGHVRGRLFTGVNGATASDEFIVNTTKASDQVQPAMTTLADGRVIAVWSDLGGNGGDQFNGVRAQIFDPRTEGVEIFGTALADDLVGTRFDDFFDGNAGDDRIDGGSGDDTLEGGEGADTIIGGGGNDTARYSNSDGSVEIDLQAGTASGGDANGDSLSGIENVDGSLSDDTLLGDAKGNQLSGLDGFDVLDGRGGNDVLDGGFVGGDFLFGGSGDDLLIGGSQADQLNGGEGDDTVSYRLSQSGVTVSLAAGNIAGIGGHAQGDSLAFIENLLGSDFADTLTGNNLANRLDGGLGADRMSGGAGNDTYIVDNAVDTPVEASGNGTDRVISSISFSLGANIENLELTGSAKANGTGNGLANTITGNSAANVLDGKAGADIMQGGAGNDTYIVDNAGDKAIEAAGGGIDAVISSVAFTLGAEVENLRLVGAADAVAKASPTGVNGTGNALANTMTGSAGANLLDGGSGNDMMKGEAGKDKLIGGLGDDRLSGGLGKDKLTGGEGDDSFVFDAALGKANADKIGGFKSKDDSILLDSDLFDGLAVGELKKNAYFEGEAAHDGNDRIILTDKGKLLFDQDGKGGEKAVLFAKVGKDADLSHNDFLVI